MSNDTDRRNTVIFVGERGVGPVSLLEVMARTRRPFEAAYRYSAFVRGLTARRIDRITSGTGTLWIGMNLLEAHPVSGHWCDVCEHRAAEIASRWKLSDFSAGYLGVILCGERVARAFLGDQYGPDRLFRPFASLGSLGCVPHPSGTNRQWNDPATMRRARATYRAVVDYDGEYPAREFYA